MGFYILYIILFEWAFAFLRTSKWFFPRSGHTWPVTFSDRQAFLGVITRGRVAPPGENSWDLRQRKLKFMTKHEQSWTIHHLSRWSIPGHKLILVLTSGNDKNQALHQSNSYHVFFRQTRMVKTSLKTWPKITRDDSGLWLRSREKRLDTHVYKLDHVYHV